VVQNLNLAIAKGEIYGFLGPNGAGKTTTVRMLLGLTVPDSGTIRINGEVVSRNDSFYRNQIGVVPEKHPSGMWKWMSAYEYLQLFCRLYSVEQAEMKIEEILTRLQLWPHRHKYIRQFSRGMLQKLSFARATIHNPQILLLDEPISGLDPYGISQIRDLIAQEHAKGKTIIISSHLLSEIEKFCTRVGIMYGGQLVQQGPTKEVIASLIVNRVYHIDVETADEALLESLRAQSFVSEVKVEGRLIVVTVDKNDDYRKQLSKICFDHNLPPLLIQEQAHSLEEAFLSLTQGEQK
ncbi:MAG: ABC transporter ATP-binding protein, partial [Sphaerochaetaceae bacterium]